MTKSWLERNGGGLKPHKSISSGFNMPGTVVSTADKDVFESPIPKGDKLKKKDLYRYENLNTIRDYMVSNKGINYEEAEDETLVEDYMDHMRRFNTNVIATAGEARYISKADERTKALAGNAYKLYDSMGNVFVNDGFYGAVDGVFDYVQAVASDPTNYIGLLTGGLGKGAALGLTQASKIAIKEAAKLAASKAAKSGATKKAIDKAGREAGEAMTEKLIKSGRSAPQMAKIRESAVKAARSRARLQQESLASLSFKKEKFAEAGKKAVLQTTAIDALLAGLQDNAIQNIYLDAGAQTEYSAAQTALSLAFGGVGGGLHYTFGKFEGMSGLGQAVEVAKAASKAKELPKKALEEVKQELKKLRSMPHDQVKALSKGEKANRTKRISALQKQMSDLNFQAIGDPLLNAKGAEAAKKVIKKELTSWQEKVKGGEELLTNNYLPEGLLRNIVVGDDNKGGLAEVFRDQGIKIRRDTKVSDMLTNLVTYMPEKELVEFSADVLKATGVHLGDIAELPINIRDVIAADVSRAGRTLSVMSQFRRSIDGGVVTGNELLVETLAQKEVRDTLEGETALLKRAKPIAYGQNVWKRLLVSSPATTAANVMGFGQFFTGQIVADLLTSTNLTIAGQAMRMAGKTEKADELFRQSKVYRQIQVQKMQNFLDPYTTHDAYMNFLELNKDVKGLLFETVGAGVERSAKRYGIGPENAYFRNAEKFTDAAMTITGVRVQDTFTKSQMFMTELDKYLRLKKKRTLQDVLEKGDLETIDDDVIGGAVDITLRSVFSKDYTTDDQLLGTAAKWVEMGSNTPLLGTVIPFGRFMNNVVATAYQWSPFSGLFAASRIAKAAKAGGQDITSMEAVSRSLVGTAALGMAMLYSEKQQKEGLAFNEINAGGGTIVDVRNVFPFSLWLAVGRGANLRRKGEPISKELREDIMAQLAIGQVARDTQFANDIYNVFDFMTGQKEGGDRGASLDALYKSLGNIAAGATRPLDAINKAVGYMAENDIAKDVRQARGLGPVFTQSASKYFDNILEVMIGETETLTGENLRVATRKGDVYDPNPLSRIFGISVKQGRTAAEKAYSLAEMKTWTADSRTKIPMYDRIFNESLAPLLEVKMNRLVKDRRFINGDLEYRRGRLKYELTRAREEVRKSLDFNQNQSYMDRLRYKVSVKGTKDQRTKAIKYLKTQGVDSNLEDFNFTEINMYNSYIDHLEYLAKGN